LSGRIPDGVVKVRITLTDRRRAIVTPHHGIWFVVALLHLRGKPIGVFTVASSF